MIFSHLLPHLNACLRGRWGMRTSLSVLGAALLFLSSSVNASEYQLETNQWESLVIPANPNGATVADLLGDDMADLQFGVDWIVFLYDPDTQAYKSPTTDSKVMEEGRAFWIIQISGEAVTLNIPLELPSSETVQSQTCISQSGCFQIKLPVPLPNEEPRVKFDFIGSPFPFETALDAWRITTDTDDDICSSDSGCTLSQAISGGYTAALWRWDNDLGDSGDYARPTSGDVLQPWQGFWVVSNVVGQQYSPILEIPVLQSTLSVRVTTPDGEPVFDAFVLAEGGGGVSAESTDAEGRANLTLAANTAYVLNIESDNENFYFAPQTKRVLSPGINQSIALEVPVLPADFVQNYSAAQEIMARAPGGAQVTIAANGLVDSDGERYTGNIVVKLTSVDVSDANELAAFPGDFSGVPEGGPKTPIISLGTTNFDFTDDDDNPLQLSENAQAEIFIPIFDPTYQDGSPVALGDEIPLWFLNEDTGIWQQEGLGTVVPNPDSQSDATLALSASVGHFSWWNCDVSMNAVRIRVRVDAQAAGVALVKGTTTADLGWRPNTVETTVNIGDTTRLLNVPNGVEVCYSADATFTIGTTASSNTVCATYTSNPLSPLVLTVADLDQPFNFQASATMVNGFPGLPIKRVTLSPTSVESTVSYENTINNLPLGLSISPVNETTYAEIAGIVDLNAIAGTYSVDILGTAADGETATQTITFIIADEIPRPQMLGGTAVINGNFEINEYDFKIGSVFNGNSGPRNVGGPATSWSLTGPALPEGMEFDELTGIVKIPFDRLFDTDPSFWTWSGTIIAINDTGSSFAEITILFECEFCDPPDPE